MRKQGTAIYLLLTILSIMTYWFWPIEQDTPAEDLDTRNITPLNTLKEIQPEYDERARSSIGFDTNNYALCNQFLRDFSEHNKEWGRRNYESWKAYIEEGRYSLNDVTIAVEYFLNSNFAESFRLEYLRTTAPLTQKNKSLRSELLEMFPSMSDLGINVRIKVPNPTLESFSDATQAEKEGMIAQTKVTVDDVAYFLLDPSMSEPDILLLIEALEGSQNIVSYDRHGAITLLDYAILSARPLIVEILLKYGHQLTMDEYLGSSMEWALHALQHGYYSGKREQAVQVIEQLMDLGAPARFSSKTEQLVEGSFPRKFYKFEAEQVSVLITDFNLDLTEISMRESIRVEDHHPLILELKEQQHSDYARNQNILNADEAISQCENTKQRLKDEWKAESA